MAEVETAGLTEEERAAAKAYLKPPEGDDDLVIACVLGAREYLGKAGVSLPPAGTGRRALYDLVCHARALSAYDNRNPVITGTIVSQNPVLREMLTQLKLTEPPADMFKLDAGKGAR